MESTGPRLAALLRQRHAAAILVPAFSNVISRDAEKKPDQRAAFGIKSLRVANQCHKNFLRHVLSHIAEHPINRIEELLPWNVAAKLDREPKQAA